MQESISLERVVDISDSPESLSITAQRIRLHCFRNYEALDLELDSGFNVFAGPNAQGKTNLLEAVHFVSTTRLLRGQRELEAIRFGSDSTKVELELAETGTVLGMSLERGSRKRATLNGLGMTRASDLLGRLPCVCISGEDMSMIRGEPADRRMFLDLELSSLYPVYLRHLSVYKRSLEQRNALLRFARENTVDSAAFEVWEDALAIHGSALREMRMIYLEELSPFATENHRWMGQGEVLELAPETKDENLDEESLRRNLGALRGQDIARGSTTLGPHRDDLRILIGGVEARLFGSQGQQRTSAIAIKLATLEFAHQHWGFPPVLLLDDILSDLDERRRSLLVELVSARARQAILTCTEASAAGPDILQKARCFNIHGGKVSIS